MKKLIVTIITLAMLLTLVGCGGSDKKEEKLSIDPVAVGAQLAKESDFEKNSMVPADKIELKYGAILDCMESGVFCLPSDSEKANMFIIAKAKEGQQEELYLELKMVVEAYDHSWTDLIYNAEEADKVKNRLEKTVDGYYICIISSDNTAVYNKIVK